LYADLLLRATLSKHLTSVVAPIARCRPNPVTEAWSGLQIDTSRINKLLFVVSRVDQSQSFIVALKEKYDVNCYVVKTIILSVSVANVRLSTGHLPNNADKIQPKSFGVSVSRAIVLHAFLPSACVMA
jgi:hypothetical protein